MEKVLLLSTAYSWFIGLIVLMVVMAVLFVFIALAALKPVKMDDIQTTYDDALKKLLSQREADLTMEYLKSDGDEKAKEEIMIKLREVNIARDVVTELTDDQKYADKPIFGVDPNLTEDEAASLEKETEKVAIEKTFDNAAEEEGLKKSFSAQLIQSGDEVKVWYFELKNCILCYEKTKVRMHWNNEKFYIGRNNVAALTMRGKTLCLYLALDSSEYSSRFPVKASTSKVYEQTTPCLFRIKSSKNVKQAKELISLMMSDYGVMYVRTNHSIYALPYEDDDALIARGLVKQVDPKTEVAATADLPTSKEKEEESTGSKAEQAKEQPKGDK